MVYLPSYFSTFINISVLQGSILGPLLFLCFINDMDFSNKLEHFYFADDSTALEKSANIYASTDVVNSKIQN